jgi:hypothetical membrane protein
VYSSLPTKKPLLPLFGAILWMLCCQFFLAEQIVRHGWTTPYRWSENYISDLGAVHCANRPPDSDHYVCSPWHALMNASFVLQGVLILGGSLLAARLFPPGRLRTAATVLIGIAGVSISVVGFAPEDVRPGPHFAAAAVHFLCGNAGMILLGRALLREASPPRRLTGALSVLAGIVGYVGLALLASGPLLQWGAAGGWERVTAYPFPLWLTGMGGYLSRQIVTMEEERSIPHRYS